MGSRAESGIGQNITLRAGYGPQDNLTLYKSEFVPRRRPPMVIDATYYRGSGGEDERFLRQKRHQ